MISGAKSPFMTKDPDRGIAIGAIRKALRLRVSVGLDWIGLRALISGYRSDKEKVLLVCGSGAENEDRKASSPPFLSFFFRPPTLPSFLPIECAFLTRPRPRPRPHNGTTVWASPISLLVIYDFF